ncbi:MAG: cupin domain-containing protein [Gammaproteobacteria bacterium]|nr:MAG: cupin domain-containing protein [Gammaproteobacteria bacterium]
MEGTEILGELRAADFLNHYWQKKPLLIRQAIPGFSPNLTAEELAGLSLDDFVNSRIVLEKHGSTPWECRYGPFTEADYATLPDSHWTLLVQDVEKHLPDFISLLDHFLFLPRWRIDDLMVSYAVPHGSVGPHTDQYDVFLLQASGKRKWQIQQHDIQTDNLLRDTDLQILQEFKAEQEWILEPGDMLYLPPGVAHHGIAVDECVTFSIGFRAPSIADLVHMMAEHIASEMGDNQRYTDGEIQPTNHPGELNYQAVSRIRQQLDSAWQSGLDDLELFLGQHLSESHHVIEESEDITLPMSSTSELEEAITHHKRLQIHPSINMIYVRQSDGIVCFVDGQRFRIAGEASASVMQLIDHYSVTGVAKNQLIKSSDVMKMLYVINQNSGLILSE